MHMFFSVSICLFAHVWCSDWCTIRFGLMCVIVVGCLLSATRLKTISHLECTLHAPVTRLAHNCHASATHLPRACHALAMHLPRTCHASATHLPHTCLPRTCHAPVLDFDPKIPKHVLDLHCYVHEFFPTSDKYSKGMRHRIPGKPWLVSHMVLQGILENDLA
jgi:hypothetical protein